MDVLIGIGAFWISTWFMLMYKTIPIITRLVETYEIALVQKFKILHPKGALGAQLKTVEDLMIKGDKIPFINQKLQMKKALSLITKKKLGVLIAIDKKKFTTGIITDGQIRRFSQKNSNLKSLNVNDIMTTNPLSVDKDTLASKALAIIITISSDAYPI